MISRDVSESYVHSVATAFPPHAVDRDATIQGLEQLFPNEDKAFIRTIVERSGVSGRRMALPPEGIIRPRSFTVRQAEYREVAERISLEAAAKAIERAGMSGHDIDAVIDVSCTGVLIPALDVFLAPRLGLRPTVQRYPMTEAGCAGGALALGLAARLARCGMNVLVIAVELCSLSLVRDDRERANLVAGVLFGDGAAAAVVGPKKKGPRIAAVGSHLFTDTSNVMGFDVGEHGLKLVLRRELPAILERHLKGVIVEFLRENETEPSDVARHLLHTGGRRVLEAYAEMFELKESDLRYSWTALDRYGNLSSAAILSVLELAIEDQNVTVSGRSTLLVAFGPGLSAEMLLLDDGVHA